MKEERNRYQCKICGRPNPDVVKKQGKEPDFKEYLFWTKEMAIQHIRDEHPEIAEEIDERNLWSMFNSEEGA